MMEPLFCTLDSQRIADIIGGCKHYVCYAAPGVLPLPAQALAEAAARLGPEMITVCLDVDEQVLRLGFGDIVSVRQLRDAGIHVSDARGLRTALVLVDEEGYVFTPTALYLEAEPMPRQAANAMRLSPDQLREALARLSPAAKAIALGQAKTDQERKRIAALPVEVGSQLVTDAQIEIVDSRLREAPPVKFDLARQVRVFSAYLQYVELSLTGAAIQNHRLTIPKDILALGGDADLEGRLRTTVELIERDSELSSKGLNESLGDIRKNFTRALGKTHGRVVLKSAKPGLEAKLKIFRSAVKAHQTLVADQLQANLDRSRKQVVDYYVPKVMANPPDALLGQLPNATVTARDASKWLDSQLSRVFPSADALLKKMQLEVRYMDVTFETLNEDGFLESLEKAFPLHDWVKAYHDFRAAGEATS